MERDDSHGKIRPRSRGLNVLLVEDSLDDAELCRRVLNKNYPELHLDVVSTPQEFIARLRAEAYDLILSDYTLEKWTAPDALDLLRKEKRDIPFILVTGSLGEEKAVACIKNGMADFILKDRLERLPIAIARAMEEKGLRDEYRKAENSIRESEAKFRALADAIPASIFIEEKGLCCYVNRAAEDITGYSREELLAMNFSQLIHPDSKDAVTEHQTKRDKSGQSAERFEIMIQPKGKERRWLDVSVGTFTNDGAPATLTTAFDITERKRANREIQNDVTTGLPNRQHLGAIFDTEASRTRRTGRAFSLLFFSLDGMNQIVKKQGQLVAGQALRRAASTTRLHCRNLDTIARIGADQLAMVLPETNTEGALILGGRIAARLSRADQELPLSCRFAAVSYPSDGETMEDVLKAADRQIQATSQR